MLVDIMQLLCCYCLTFVWDRNINLRLGVGWGCRGVVGSMEKGKEEAGFEHANNILTF
jgi:hypothetical protein